MLGLKRRGGLAVANRALLVAATVCLAGTAAAATPVSAGTFTGSTGRVKDPRQGQYVGETRQQREATLYVGSRSIKKAVFEVGCGLGSGRVVLRRVQVRKTKRGFEFESRRRRPVTYDDGHAPDKASVVISGRFARTGRKASGTVRVSSPHCGSSGEVRWSATYSPTPVRAPAPGWYTGPTKQQRKLGLYVSGESIKVAAIAFKCGTATGRTALNDVDMRRTRQGFAFDLRAHGSVTYSDGYPDENAAVDLTGVFARSGSTASGRLRVNSPRCGGTGWVGWTVARQSNG
jgi:hypothetical protein